MKDYIDATSFKEMILCAEQALHANERKINELNVFPVPDGDTGTNMGLTMQYAATELRKKNFSSVSDAADCTASALLRGARGNSGVILSLLFRGIAKRLKSLDSAGALEFAAAMNDGVEAAYNAVMKPAEGTILTVSRLASESAYKAANLGADLEGTLMCAIKAGNEALENTQELNPVLKKAGVVDAGGKGYMVILEAILASLREEIVSGGESSSYSEDNGAFSAFTDEDITFTYDTVFIVKKIRPTINLDPFRAFLSSIGDSLVISEDDDIFKVHVHTDIPGDALTESSKYGTLELAKIENMRQQHDDLLEGKKAISTDDLEQSDEVLAPEKEYGIVTVCAGDGIADLFKELGADTIVTGGQTMNPSTDDILKEINRTPAKTVFVFPNNKNIIMAAQQCIPLTEKEVIVIQTKTIPQGISALLNFNPSADKQQIIDDMNSAIENVHTAMVTYAARDSDFDGYAIHAGEYLALLDGKLVGSYTNLKTLFSELSWSFNDLNPEYITVYYGNDVSAEDADGVCGIISGVFPDAEVSVVNGGQPVYYYMISVE